MTHPSDPPEWREAYGDYIVDYNTSMESRPYRAMTYDEFVAVEFDTE